MSILTKIVKKILLEPLLHFLLLGTLIYLYYNFTQQTQTKPQIIITKQDIQQLKKNFVQKFSQQPTPTIINALIQKEIQNKILIKEANKLELDKGNKESKNSLIKKMNFILNAKSAIQEPTEQELREYYLKHKTDYARKTSFSFYFIHFNNLNKSQSDDFYSLLQFADKRQIAKKINDKSTSWLKKEFGNYFTIKLLLLQKGVWHKAIHSNKGMEFVYITDYNTTDILPFDDVQERVYNDYKRQLHKKNYLSAYLTLFNTYIISIEQ